MEQQKKKPGGCLTALGWGLCIWGLLWLLIWACTGHVLAALSCLVAALLACPLMGKLLRNVSRTVLTVVAVAMLIVSLIAMIIDSMLWPWLKTDSADPMPAPTASATVSATEAPTATPAPTAEPVAEKNLSADISCNPAKVWTNSIDTVWAQTIVAITNTGDADLYLSAGSYDLEDENGALVASKTLVGVYPQIIAPGETAYMYDETTLDNSPIAEGELNVVPRCNVRESKSQYIRLPLSDVQIHEDDYGTIKMMGRVENNGNQDLEMVYIEAMLFDADGNPLGHCFTILTDTLAMGDKIGFEMSEFCFPPDVDLEDIADYSITAYPMQYQFN